MTIAPSSPFQLQAPRPGAPRFGGGKLSKKEAYAALGQAYKTHFPPPVGRLDGLRVATSLLRYTMHGENREMLKAMLLKYGVPAAAFGAAAVSGPLAWLTALVAWPITYVAGKRGDKLIARLNPEKLAGPYSHINKIQSLWDEALESAKPQVNHPHFKSMVGEYNKLVVSVLNDDSAQAKRLISRLQLRTEQRSTAFLRHFFNVNLVYRNQWQGKVIAGMRSMARKLPAFLRGPILFTTLGMQGVLTLLSHKKVQQTLVKTAQKTVQKVV